MELGEDNNRNVSATQAETFGVTGAVASIGDRGKILMRFMADITTLGGRRDDYVRLVQRALLFLRQNGLLQTVAFIKSRERGREGEVARVLYGHLLVLASEVLETKGRVDTKYEKVDLLELLLPQESSVIRSLSLVLRSCLIDLIGIAEAVEVVQPKEETAQSASVVVPSSAAKKGIEALQASEVK